MSKIEQTFSQLKQQHQTAFMPFVTAGDPDLEFTRDLLVSLSAAGCHLIELGFPYSDPIADGPVIQESYNRALRQGVSIRSTFEMLSQATPEMAAPVVAMVSYAQIFRFGREAFLEAALACGLAGAIVPDLPIDEADEFSSQCIGADFALVQLITPTTSDSRAAKIAAQATGFIYYVSVAGITGERRALPAPLQQRLQWLRKQTSTPICVGFGISQPEHATELCDYADGIIVGSAIVKRIATVTPNSREEVAREIVSYAQSMLDAIGTAKSH